MPLVLRIATFLSTFNLYDRSAGAAQQQQQQAPAWVSCCLTPSTTVSDAISFVSRTVETKLSASLYASPPPLDASSLDTPRTSPTTAAAAGWALCIQDASGVFRYCGRDGDTTCIVGGVPFLPQVAWKFSEALSHANNNNSHASADGQQQRVSVVPCAVVPLDAVHCKGAHDEAVGFLDAVAIPAALHADPILQSRLSTTVPPPGQAVMRPPQLLPTSLTSLSMLTGGNDGAAAHSFFGTPSPTPNGKPAFADAVDVQMLAALRSSTTQSTNSTHAPPDPRSNPSPPLSEGVAATATANVTAAGGDSSNCSVHSQTGRFIQTRSGSGSCMESDNTTADSTREVMAFQSLLQRGAAADEALQACRVAESECKHLSTLIDFYERELLECEERNRRLRRALDARACRSGTGGGAPRNTILSLYD